MEAQEEPTPCERWSCGAMPADGADGCRQMVRRVCGRIDDVVIDVGR